MSRWGEEYDGELLKEEKIKVDVLFSFKSMTLVLNRIIEETREYDDKYPKSELLKIWASALGVLFFLFLFSYNILICATGLFIFFYGFVLIQVYKAWKRFKYPGGKYWLMTVLALAVEFALARVVQGFIFG